MEYTNHRQSFDQSTWDLCQRVQSLKVAGGSSHYSIFDNLPDKPFTLSKNQHQAQSNLSKTIDANARLSEVAYYYHTEYLGSKSNFQRKSETNPP